MILKIVLFSLHIRAIVFILRTNLCKSKKERLTSLLVLPELLDPGTME